MKKLTIIAVLFSLCWGYSFSQCNEKLVYNCAMIGAKNLIYMNNFKARLKKAKKNKPYPVARHTVVLNKGARYRFWLCNADESPGEGVIQLSDRNNVLGATFYPESKKDYEYFDFSCNKTGVYNVFVYFKNGQEGCAVGIVSLVQKTR